MRMEMTASVRSMFMRFGLAGGGAIAMMPMMLGCTGLEDLVGSGTGIELDAEPMTSAVS